MISDPGSRIALEDAEKRGVRVFPFPDEVGHALLSVRSQGGTSF